MSRSIDYYFSLISPFAYLGHLTFLAVAQKHGARITYKPVNVLDVFKTSGALPLPQRPPSRQAYRLIELQRIADLRQLPLTLKPKHFPTDPSFANAATAAIVAADGNPDRFMFAVFQALWVHELDISDEAVIRALLLACEHDPGTVLAAAGSQAMQEHIEANTQDAIASGALGTPTYVLDGEPFWGQDRIEYLDQALSSGRGPYQAV
ncbi:MAG: 2-hydroxychromene-2-carboxylate isomerase [Hyphomicrobiales bacterium]